MSRMLKLHLERLSEILKYGKAEHTINSSYEIPGGVGRVRGGGGGGDCGDSNKLSACWRTDRL